MKKECVDIKQIVMFVFLYLKKNEISINPLKLQKLLYYIQAWHLVYFEMHPLFEDEPEAWVNGPVYRVVYNELKKIKIYQNMDIDNKVIKDIDASFEKIKSEMKLSSNQQEFLGKVLTHYGTMTHDKLVLMTHSEEPWIQARKGLGPFDYSSNVINHNDMYEYYSNRLKSTKV